MKQSDPNQSPFQSRSHLLPRQPSRPEDLPGQRPCRTSGFRWGPADAIGCPATGVPPGRRTVFGQKTTVTSRWHQFHSDSQPGPDSFLRMGLFEFPGLTEHFGQGDVYVCDLSVLSTRSGEVSSPGGFWALTATLLYEEMVKTGRPLLRLPAALCLNRMGSPSGCRFDITGLACPPPPICWLPSLRL